MDKPFRSGFVALAGRPNVGKSTLMNALVGEKVSIISDHPQTTRNQIRGVLTRPDYQIVFIDTPGVHRPQTHLGEYMVEAAQRAWRDVDLIMMVLDVSKPIGKGDQWVVDQLEKLSGTPVVLVLNKIDLVEKTDLLAIMDQFSDQPFINQIVPISATQGDGIEDLEKVVASFLVEGPRYFPDDMYTDQPEQQLITEIIREKALALLRDEVPHGIGVEIIQMTRRPDQDMVDVHVNLLCEKTSHKAMIVGKQGTVLRKIGMRARQELEGILGSPMNLQLWVRVKPGWRNSPTSLRELGYDPRQL